MGDELPQFLCSFFSELEVLDIKYCVLRQYESLPLELSGSDLDVLIDPLRYEAAVNALLAASHLAGFDLISRTAYGQVNFFHFCMKKDFCYQFVRIDLNRDQRYFGAALLTAGQILERAIKYKTFWVAHPVHEVLLSLIFPLLSSGKVKKKHISRILTVASEYKSDFFQELRRCFGISLANKIHACVCVGSLESISRYRSKIINTLLLSGYTKAPFQSFYHLCIFTLDLAKLRLKPPGVVAVISHKNKEIKTQVIRMVFERSQRLLLGDHRLVRKGTFIARKPEFLSRLKYLEYAFLTMDWLLAYFAYFRKSARRHGIVILDNDWNDFMQNRGSKAIESLLSRVVFIDLNQIERHVYNNGGMLPSSGLTERLVMGGLESIIRKIRDC